VLLAAFGLSMTAIELTATWVGFCLSHGLTAKVLGLPGASLPNVMVVLTILHAIPNAVLCILAGALFGRLAPARALLYATVFATAVTVVPLLFGPSTAILPMVASLYPIPICLTVAWLLRLRNSNTASPNCCKECGYDLTGNTSGVCPECGEKARPPAGLADSEGGRQTMATAEKSGR